jgi:GNAT superfamily N-acetyltransferase
VKPLTMRPARAGDAEAISALVTLLSRYFLADPERPEDAAGFLAQLSPAACAERLSDPRFRHHVAEVDGALAGFVAIRDDGHLYHLFVAERFHGHGIATRLWGIGSGEARARGNPGRFTVNSSLHAVPVYERFGFATAGTPQVQDGIAFLPMLLVDDAQDST